TPPDRSRFSLATPLAASRIRGRPRRDVSGGQDSRRRHARPDPITRRGYQRDTGKNRIGYHLRIPRDPCGEPREPVRQRDKSRRLELPAGTRLFKFTGHALFGQAGAAGRWTTPWWALVEPRPDLDDPGLDAVLDAARRSGRPLVQYVRDAYAVMFAWNTLALP